MRQYVWSSKAWLLATLKLTAIVVGKLLTEKNICGIARYPGGSTAFLYWSWNDFDNWNYNKIGQNTKTEMKRYLKWLLVSVFWQTLFYLLQLQCHPDYWNCQCIVLHSFAFDDLNSMQLWYCNCRTCLVRKKGILRKLHNITVLHVFTQLNWSNWNCSLNVWNWNEL